MIKEKFKNIIYNLVLAEKSATRLTLSFCLGNFIAWSPTIPFQTPLIFILSWPLRLNTTVTFTAVYLINPFFLATLPIYIADYFFGVWLFNSVLNLDMERFNPSWVNKFSDFLGRYIDMKRLVGEDVFCFWCLIVGGFILAFVLSAILYPIMRPIFGKLVEKIHKKPAKENL